MNYMILFRSYLVTPLGEYLALYKRGRFYLILPKHSVLLTRTKDTLRSLKNNAAFYLVKCSKTEYFLTYDHIFVSHTSINTINHIDLYKSCLPQGFTLTMINIFAPYLASIYSYLIYVFVFVLSIVKDRRHTRSYSVKLCV